MSSFGDVSMHELFCVELQDNTQILIDGLLAVERSAGETAALEAMMRAAHSIKGAARVVGIESIVGLAHGIENMFVGAQANVVVLEGALTDVLLSAVDLIAAISRVGADEVSTWVAANDEMITAITRSLAQVTVSPSPEAPESRPSASAGPASGAATWQAAVSPEPATVGPTSRVRSQNSNVLRVSAESFSRLTGMASQSMVETKRLHAFTRSFQYMALRQAQIGFALDEVAMRIYPGNEIPPSFDAARRAIAELRKLLGDMAEDFGQYAGRTDELNSSLYYEVLASRMRPFEECVRGIPRLVRDLSQRLGKHVRFDIMGPLVGVDRDILDKLEAPLTHIVHNAIDHGIELPASRSAAGKPAEASIVVHARHVAGMLGITVSDDGAGVDIDRVRKRSVDRGLVSFEMAAGLSEPEILEFLFLPGFSTSATVTDVSGRGVGLDVVQRMAQEVGGTVRIATQRGVGTTFHLQVPLTLSVVRGMLVDLSGEGYVFPLSRIERVLTVPKSEILSVEGRLFFRLDGDNIALVALEHVLGFPAPDLAHDDVVSVVVVSNRVHRYGVAVDKFTGEEDLVVRPLDPRLRRVPGVSSSAISQDGRPLLILDVDDVVGSILRLLSSSEAPRMQRRGQADARRKRVLIVDDSITVREVEKQILQNAGYAVQTAVDGVDGWNAAREGDFDLVITDLDMPRMTGLELIEALKGHPQLAGLPIVVVSYKEGEKDRRDAAFAGAAAYLTKGSFHDDTLRKVVDELLSGS